MIDINVVELYLLMLLGKFQMHRPSGFGGEDVKSIYLFIGLADIVVMWP